MTARRPTFTIPYGDAQIAQFPAVVDQINADPEVRLVTHLGDIKSGSSLCTNDYFAQIRAQFDRFRDPLVYTSGDNEWTDCHRPTNGSYDPAEGHRAPSWPADADVGADPLHQLSRRRPPRPQAARHR
jgi:hypothetical protein